MSDIKNTSALAPRYYCPWCGCDPCESPGSCKRQAQAEEYPNGTEWEQAQERRNDEEDWSR